MVLPDIARNERQFLGGLLQLEPRKYANAHTGVLKVGGSGKFHSKDDQFLDHKAAQRHPRLQLMGKYKPTACRVGKSKLFLP